MMRATFFMLCMCLALAAYGEESNPAAALPREPDSHAVGYYCRMTLSEHPGPKGQLLLKGATYPLCSLPCAMP
jgi:copper chaperone NosL